MSIKEEQKPAKEFRPLFERAMTLIQQRYPWVEASRRSHDFRMSGYAYLFCIGRVRRLQNK